jgi:hypothetical protein
VKLLTEESIINKPNVQEYFKFTATLSAALLGILSGIAGLAMTPGEPIVLSDMMRLAIYLFATTVLICFIGLLISFLNILNKVPNLKLNSIASCVVVSIAGFVGGIGALVSDIESGLSEAIVLFGLSLIVIGILTSLAWLAEKIAEKRKKGIKM